MSSHIYIVDLHKTNILKTLKTKTHTLDFVVDLLKGVGRNTYCSMTDWESKGTISKLIFFRDFLSLKFSGRKPSARCHDMMHICHQTGGLYSSKHFKHSSGYNLPNPSPTETGELPLKPCSSTCESKAWSFCCDALACLGTSKISALGMFLSLSFSQPSGGGGEEVKAVWAPGHTSKTQFSFRGRPSLPPPLHTSICVRNLISVSNLRLGTTREMKMRLPLYIGNGGSNVHFSRLKYSIRYFFHILKKTLLHEFLFINQHSHDSSNHRNK